MSSTVRWFCSPSGSVAVASLVILASGMPDAWRLALLATGASDDIVAEDLRKQQERAQHARDSRLMQLEERRAAAQPPVGAASQAMVLLSCPVAASAMGVKAPTMKQALQEHVPCVVSLAVSPRFRGSGPAVERCRLVQHMAGALVATAALRQQETGIERSLGEASDLTAANSDSEGLHRGLSAMWDGASQKTRSLKGKEATNAPRDVEAIVVLACIVTMPFGAGQSEGKLAWEPWLCPPTLVAASKHEYLLATLKKVLPFAYDDAASVERFCCGSGLTVVWFTFDAASSNYTAFGKIIRLAEESGRSCIAIHGERCLTHQLHHIKSACVSLKSIAPMVFSLSRIVGSDRAVSGLERAMRQKVRQALVMRYSAQPPPDQDDLRTIVRFVMGLDGYNEWEEPAQRGRPTGHRRQRSLLARHVEELCARCRYDRETKQWVHYVLQHRPSQRQTVDLEQAADAIVEPIFALLTRRKWQNAALSRWTGVLSCLKKVVVGTLLGNLLPAAMAGLSACMGVTEEKASPPNKHNTSK